MKIFIYFLLTCVWYGIYGQIELFKYTNILRYILKWKEIIFYFLLFLVDIFIFILELIKEQLSCNHYFLKF